jgi:hypothetical protein
VRPRAYDSFSFYGTRCYFGACILENVMSEVETELWYNKLMAGKVVGFIPYDRGCLKEGLVLKVGKAQHDILMELFCKQMDHLGNIRDNKISFTVLVSGGWDRQYVGVQFYDNVVYISMSPAIWRC